MNPAVASGALERIAILGMSGRFPGARNLEEYWANLCGGVESIRSFSEEELQAAGLDAGIVSQPGYVNAGAPIEDAEMFDASFFGITPREAQSLDPQRRVFLECAWHALEDAGYVPERVDGPIGIFGGASMSSYMARVQANRELVAAVGGYQVMIGNDKDHLTTYAAYKLNLTGPAITVQTACSTSLVAAAMACQSLANQECDLALAGGVSVRIPQHYSYFYEEGGILSPDGHCRTFDAAAQGTVGGAGVGLVVLKRLADALRDGDRIRAVVLGWAVNNDGSLKVGYTAPSVEGQAAVIATALVLAGAEPDTIGYIEAHGTATPLGDPIEIAGLTQAFGRTRRRNFCAIGSVKSNIGHLDAAAGVAGLIKAALCVERKMLPPTLHFEKPNPVIDFKNSPVYVQDRLSEWNPAEGTCRAGVSAFGIGGTNAHLILEEVPQVQPSGPSRASQLLVLSARGESALDQATANLAGALRSNPDLPLADAAYTLAVGRRAFSHRRFIVCQTANDAIESLERSQLRTSVATADSNGVVFLFPGQGAQHAGMGRGLYELEPLFRHHVDRCAELLEPHLNLDIRPAIYAADASDEELRQTSLAQPALFVVEYALAHLLMSWGIQPAAMIGHSLGEYVAACLAGVFSVEDALALVAARGKLMQGTGSGAMLATSLSEEEARALLPPGIEIAAVNGPAQTVLSGPQSAIERLEELLPAHNASCVRLHTSHAFHSETMDTVLDEFRERVRAVRMRPPAIPYIANRTGTWQTAAVADPEYWVGHLRHAVLFGDGCRELCRGYRTFLEVGPGSTLTKLVRAYFGEAGNGKAIPATLEQAGVLNAVGELWASGVEISWPKYFDGERRLRVPLPLYPFERRHYDAGAPAAATQQMSPLGKIPDVGAWFYMPSWRQTPPARDAFTAQSCLLFLDTAGLAAAVAEQLRQAGVEVSTVEPGSQFEQTGDRAFRVRPQETADYAALIEALVSAGGWPEQILHFWNVPPTAGAPGSGFYPLFHFTQALAMRPEAVSILVVSGGVHAVRGDETIHPEKAGLLGLCRVAPHEHPNQRWRNVDVEWPGTDVVQQVLAEAALILPDPVAAYRGRRRFVETVEPMLLPPGPPAASLLRREGVYLITGGLGGIGLAIAEHLAKEYHARLVLIGRSPVLEDSPKWKKIAAMEEAGGAVLVCAADVANREQMRQAISQAQDRFGPLNGVIHSAGVAGGGMIQVKERAVAEAVLAPKVEGTLTLHALLEDTQLDFFVTCSSLTSLLGGFGQVDYCAANAFLDAWAQRESGNNGRRTLAINWDAWTEVGMAVNTALPPEMEAYRAEVLKNAIRPEEGVDAFCRALDCGLPQVCISTVYLPWRIAQARPMGPTAVPPEAAAAAPALRHPRPQLPNAFVPASTEMETLVEKIWQDLLGVEQVGANDNFFELGGHSLLATQMATRIRSALGVNISVREIFEAPTIAKLAGVLEEMLNQSDELARMIAMVEEMSEEQVKAQLEQGE
jgi:acyl transferase domain-containing protein/acyl carrier protein